ncbi:MAG: hypothetical protein JWM76_1386 [Pseudonocardiales bacterium]|nr:hypothetical protein [Pseudonocardiales bacterium]
MTSVDVLERNKDTVARFLKLMSADDLDAAFALLTEDCAWFSLSSRRESSPSTVKAAVAFVTKNVMRGAIQIEPLIFTAEQDRVALLAHGSATTVEGVKYEQIYHFLYQLEGDRISRIWEIMDTAHVAEVFGTGASQRLMANARDDQTTT